MNRNTLLVGAAGALNAFAATAAGAEGSWGFIGVGAAWLLLLGLTESSGKHAQVKGALSLILLLVMAGWPWVALFLFG